VAEAERAALAQAFRLLQQGRAAECEGVARGLAEREPENARAHLALGVALRLRGALAPARAALERAAVLAPRDYAAAFELGAVLEQSGDPDGALAQYERALALRPGFAAARHAAARRLAEAGRGEEALAHLERALADEPGSAFGLHEKGWVLHRMGDARAAVPLLRRAADASDRVEWRLDLAKALADVRDDDAARAEYEAALATEGEPVRARVEYGRFHVSRGEFAAAAALFAAALERSPGDPALPVYLAQAELVQGHWQAGWRAYAHRGPRRAFEAARASRGLRYVLPRLDALGEREATLLGEQGLGDVLFFLRFAAPLAARGARLRFVGEARLASIVARALAFESARAGEAASEAAAALPILVGDLPSLEGMPAAAPSLAVAPLAERCREWSGRLASLGPRPWIGITWRAGTPSDVLAHGLSKSVPLEGLMRAIAPLPGTVLALQRAPREGEIAAASAIRGAPVHDLSAAHAHLEDALAVVSLLDRHICVSNTNVHLAACAGKAADVLVPFPPEWRWGASAGSVWFPGFRVHRQEPGGSWTRAFAALAGGA
jgi:tetratricopeptide (TPR) repeat protein